MRFICRQSLSSSSATLRSSAFRRVYSFFFSFCFSSLLISLFAMPAYLLMMPCWFSPGSRSRKLTAEEATAINTVRQLLEPFAQHNFSQRTECKKKLFFFKRRKQLEEQVWLDMKHKWSWRNLLSTFVLTSRHVSERWSWQRFTCDTSVNQQMCHRFKQQEGAPLKARIDLWIYLQ